MPGLGPAKIKLLIEHFGSAVAAIQADYDSLLSSGVSNAAIAENIVHFSKDKFLEDEYNLGQRKGVEILTSADPAFPQALQDILGAPVVLYILGKAELLHAASVGMVGSRVCSHYGVATAQRFAASFAQAGLVVVSGLARGIDTASHRGCLSANGETVAVIGCGLNHIYPKENKALMEQISRQGAVVSEMPMNTPPIAVNFPRRNRIISGLSLATVVVEAGVDSGALITAGYALEQGREVFAVPANIDYETAAGSNRLIKDGARVALGPRDVLEELSAQMELNFPAAVAAEKTPRVRLSAEEMKLYRCLSTEPVHFDELLTKTRQALPVTTAGLLNLELKGVARQLPGKYYIKV